MENTNLSKQDLIRILAEQYSKKIIITINKKILSLDIRKFLSKNNPNYETDEVVNFKLKSGVANWTINGDEIIFNTSEEFPTFEPIKLKYKRGEKLKPSYFLKNLFANTDIKWRDPIEGFSEKNVLVELSKENYDIIEKMNVDSISITEKLSELYKSKKIEFKNVSDENVKEAYRVLLRAIDIENSTNVWRFSRNDFEKIWKYICNKENRFYERLEGGDVKLPDDLNKAANKNLLSYCSKICKFLSEYIFEEPKYNYYIYDWYVAHILPFYIDSYKIDYNETIYYIDGKSKKINKSGKPSEKINNSTFDNSIKYISFHKLMELLNKKLKDINKNQLDQLMWYCYRTYSK